jgi:hypothetical protein
VFTDPEAAAVGDAEGEHTAAAQLASAPRTATYTRSRGSGCSRRRPRSARVPLDVLADVIQPFPIFSDAFLHALLELD